MNQEIELKIKGMHCSGCVSSVEKALNGVSGVANAVVNLTLEKATINGSANIDQLIKAVNSSGYTASLFISGGSHRDVNLEKLEKARKKMIIGWVATVPIMIWMGLVMVAGEMIPSPETYHAGMLLLSAVVIFFAGGETVQNGCRSIVYRSPNMDVLIVIGCLAAWSTGWLRLWIEIQPFTGISGMIMAFHLTGRYIESKARGNASSSIKKLMSLRAKEATLVNKLGDETKIDIRDVQLGDIVMVRAGETITADGTVLEGIANINESLVTGESVPAVKGKGDSVIGGTICLDSTIKIRVEKTGQNTFLSQVVRLVESAQTTKVPIQIFADKVVSIFVPVILGLSSLTFVLWYFLSEFMLKTSTIVALFLPLVPFEAPPLAQALYASIAVLVIACPCALGLATPTALMMGTSLGAKNGVLIRNGAAIQKMTEADIIFLDKTGTITTGKPRVVDIHTEGTVTKKELIQLTATLGKESTHPLSKVLVMFAKQNNVKLLEPKKIQVTPGRGIEGKVKEKTIKIGTARFTGYKTKPKEDKTCVFITSNNREIGYFLFQDKVRAEAGEIISEFKSRGVVPVLLTGDRKGIATELAQKLGISKVYAELDPDLKQKLILKHQKENHVVIMVGDGINDAPALTQADVGIAMGSGTDIAMDAGDMVLMEKGIGGLPKALALSKIVFKKIKENIFWASIYNLVAIPLAVLGLLNPVIAEVAMAFSSVNVVLNSSRLLKVSIKLRHNN